MKRVFGYCRVSTEGQAVDGVSLDAQRAKLSAWALANDMELAGVWVDAGISGKRADNRPELQAALDACCTEGGVLVVYSLSRLARSTADTLAIATRLDAAGADLVSLSEKLDTSSAAGKMLFRLMAVLAEFERDLISERTTAALAHKKSRGERVGEVPFGFRVAADGVALESDENESRIIELIQTLRSSGLSYAAIAAELDAQGVAPKKAKKWNAMTVRNVVLRQT